MKRRSESRSSLIAGDCPSRKSPSAVANNIMMSAVFSAKDIDHKARICTISMYNGLAREVPGLPKSTMSSGLILGHKPVALAFSHIHR